MTVDKKKEKKIEKEKKDRAFMGKSYKGPEYEPRKEPSETEGSEFIERSANEEDRDNDYKNNMDYDKARGRS